MKQQVYGMEFALLAIKDPSKHAHEFWAIAAAHERAGSYAFFGVVHAIATNREYRELLDIELTEKELRKAKVIAKSLLDSLATTSY